MQSLLDISNITALLITLSFVTSYVIIGGTYAHVLTNLLQGGLMIIVSLIVIYTGFKLMSNNPDFWNVIQSKDVQLLQWVNPKSNLYNDFFSVYISGFLIGAALVCQPHILTKALYVEKDKDVTQYLLVFAVVYIIFTMLLFAGFWALVAVPPEQLIDSSTGNFRQDLVMTKFLEGSFSPWLFTIISVVLVAAAMSTLDGLLVGLSTITASDLYLNIFYKKDSKISKEDKYKKAFKASHFILIILAILCFIVTLNPPELLGIFGQFGVYALVLTSLPPLLNGVFYEKPSLRLVWVFSVMAIIIHVSLYQFGSQWFPNSTLAFANPAVPGSIAIICTTIPSLIIGFIQDRKLNL
jgi:SSS family solute:Na+ symporter/sodium/pantothenate symporter